MTPDIELRPTAPAGWGFTPGTPLQPCAADLPDLPLLGLVRGKERMVVVTTVLLQNPAVLRVVTQKDIIARYPQLPRGDLSECYWNARQGYLPGQRPCGRPPGRRPAEARA